VDPILAIAVLSAFLFIFIFITGLSIRQEGRSGIEKDVELIEQKTISDMLIPAIMDVFEYEPPAYGEEESELADKISVRLGPGLKRVATAYKYHDTARQFGRFMLRCGAAGIVVEAIFISLVACLGIFNSLIAAAFSTSFFILALCGSFWYLRRKNIENAEDMSART
jgi:hypothetical protein